MPKKLIGNAQDEQNEMERRSTKYLGKLLSYYILPTSLYICNYMYIYMYYVYELEAFQKGIPLLKHHFN